MSQVTEPPPPLDQVLHALQALYTATDREERKAANLFLVRLSERSGSLPWELLWNLLAARQPEAQYCGAQLLIEKLQKTWDTVSAGDRRAVGEFLLQEALHGQRTSLVSRRLTRSLCVFCLYDQPDPVLNTFDAVIASLTQRLTTGESIALLVDFLYSLPMVATTHEFPVERRRRALSFVATRALTAINSLLVVLRAAAAANREDQGAVVLQALTSWFSIEAAGAFLWSSFTTEGPRSAVGEALQWLARPAILAKEGSEMVIELLDHPALPSYPRAFFRLLSSMVDVAQLYIRDGAVDTVSARALCVVFCEIGQDFGSLILSAASQEDVGIVARFFQVFGSLTAHRSLDISSAAFGGWEEIFDAASRSATPTPLLETLIRPCCRALLELMFSQVRFGSGHSDDEVQRYREDAQFSLLPGSYSLLGAEYLRTCWNALHRAAVSQPPSQELVEASVFLLGAVHEQLAEDVDNILLKVAMLYGQCSPQAVQLRRTLLWFIVVYADQVAQAGDTATALLVALVTDAVNPVYAALHRQIIEVVFSLCCARPAAFTSATQALLGCVERVSPPLRSSFVDAIVMLIPSHPPAQREQYMRALAAPIIERLLAAAAPVLAQATPPAAAMQALAQEIGISGSLIQIEVPDPSDSQYMLSIFSSIWPTLHRVINTHPTDEAVSKAICLWIQFSISSLRRTLASVIVEMLGDLCVAFNAMPSSGAVFALDRALEVCLQVRSSPLAPLATLEMAINLFVQRASNIAPNELMADVTLCLSLFFLAKNLVKTIPTLFCSADRTNFPPAGRALLRLALTCLGTNDQNSGKFVLLFLQALCVLQAEHTAIVTIAGSFYGDLLRALVQATVSVPRQLLPPLGDTLFALNQLNPTAFAQQMQACLSEPGFPSDAMRTDSKLQWARSLSRAQKEQFRRLVHEFSNTIRAGHEIGRFASTAAPA